jgi:hypothetical protein
MSIATDGAFNLFFRYSNSLGIESYLNTYLILLGIQSFIFILHAWLTSFSKKPKDLDKEENEDTMSIEKGSAFETFVEDKKPKGKKDKTPKKDVEFTF